MGAGTNGSSGDRRRVRTSRRAARVIKRSGPSAMGRHAADEVGSKLFDDIELVDESDDGSENNEAQVESEDGPENDEAHADSEDGVGDDNADPSVEPFPEASMVVVERRLGRPRLSLARFGVTAAVALSMALMLVGALVGYVAAERRADVWGAEAEIVLETSETQTDRFLSTQVVMAQSRSALDAAAEVVPVDRQYIEEGLAVRPIASSLALRFRFDDEDPDLAVEVVDAAVAAYLTQFEESATDTTSAVYENRIADLRSSRAEVEVDLARFETLNAQALARDEAPPFPTEERRLALESRQLLEQVAGLEQQLLLTDIQLLNRAQPSVVSAPALLDERVGPAPFTYAALGALVAAVLAAAVIFLIGSQRSGFSRQI
ncbi:MAG: hypothetical protein GY925_06930 [Actinomycetia bacterium]|nr:hypothetical protein [Actinomycetes bacterium]